MLNTDELKQLRQIIREENEPLVTRLDGLEQGQKNLEQGQTSLEQGQKNLEQGQAVGNTALKALGAGLQDVQEEVKTIRNDMTNLATKKDVDMTVEAATKELKADIFLLDAKLMRKVQSHERRIDNLERSTNTPNPDKH